MLNARAAVRTLKEYHPPLGGREGLRLDFNENTVGCSPRVLEVLRKLDSEVLAKYPQREPVEAEVSKFLGLAPEQVIPVSAQKALVAKINNDAALLQASQLPVLERALSHGVMGHRRKILRSGSKRANRDRTGDMNQSCRPNQHFQVSVS